MSDDSSSSSSSSPTVKRARLSEARAIAAVPGLFLCESFVDAASESALLRCLDALPWSTALKRRVQHYGHVYDYKARGVAPAAAPAIPDLCVEVATRLLTLEVAHDAAEFDQLIVNEYLPGQGIGAHVDAAVFGPLIASVSLGAGIVMRFSREGHEPCDVWLPRRSAVLLTGEARTLWKHAIAHVKSDPGHGARQRRVSLTFRSVQSHRQRPVDANREI